MELGISRKRFMLPFISIEDLSRRIILTLMLLALGVTTACPKRGRLSSPPVPGSGSIYHLDCSASKNGGGTQRSPWNSLGVVNAFDFRAGDRLLIKRGTSCSGPMTPRGSGQATAPIIIAAYGTGAPPIILGGTAEAAVKLFNQEYWEINDLEITGGYKYGLYVSGDAPDSTIHHIYLRNLNVHGATYTSTLRGDSGEVFIATGGVRQVLNDVLIDGVKAHDSHVSEGIYVSAGGKWIEGNGVLQPLGRNITVQNSIAHDVYGDGIFIGELQNGLLQGNVVYRSGLCPNCTGSTPVGLWQWYCHDCTVQFNESYANQSWGIDGGDFDIDYYSNNNIVQYNYGHDSAGYCVAFFGAGGRTSVNNIFRYNVCSNNARRSDLAKQGEVYVHTWEGGSLDGVQIYNNTFYWNPAAGGAALSATDATYSGTRPRFFKNNIIYATVPEMVQVPGDFSLDNNIYWTTSATKPQWEVGSKNYRDLRNYQTATGQDLHSYVADPMLRTPTYHGIGRPVEAFRLLPGSPARANGADVCAGIPECSNNGGQDFWGNRLAPGHTLNIGAHQGGSKRRSE